MTVTIRAARPDDTPRLQHIEHEACERFREVGLDLVADDVPFSDEELATYQSAGRSWVADDEHGQAVGYVLVDEVDGNAHVEQVSVLPQAQGSGVGRALLAHVQRWTIDMGKRAVTLTTFTDVPWNRPLYEHLGFSVLHEDDIGPELAALRAVETAHGLDPDLRVCMRLDLVTDR
jgi:ribosomal protein S18 acetylase RimI-like enzyme